MSKYVLSTGIVVVAFSALALFAQVRETPQTPAAPRQPSTAPSKGARIDQRAVPQKNGTEKKARRHSRQRVYLGVCTVPVEDLGNRARKRLKLKDTEGVIVVEVMPDSPAEDAGLRHGDIITHVNGKAVEDEEELSEDLNRQGPDKPIKLAIVRDGEKREITAELEEGAIEDFIPAHSGHENGMEGRGGADHATLMCIQQMERRITRLENRIDELEKTRAVHKP
ncbi:MAG TPA: PDZ domain-containing protein [Gemmataceae bacterium]|jgi:membrane-associated protease RseP (regulator of RpoE activity)